MGLNAGTPTSNVYDGNNHMSTASYDGAGNQTDGAVCVRRMFELQRRESLSDCYGIGHGDVCL